MSFRRLALYASVHAKRTADSVGQTLLVFTPGI